MGYTIRRILWILIIGSIVVAVVRIFPWQHPNDAVNMLRDTADQFGNWVKSVMSGFHLGELPKPEPIVLPQPTTAG